MTRTGAAAVAYARSRVGHKMPAAGRCLQFTRECFGVGARYPSAIEAWNHAIRHPGDRNPPAAVPVYFHTPSKYRHIAVHVGGGAVVSTFNADIRLYHSLGDVERIFHGPYLGWSEDVNGVRIWSGSTPHPPVPPPTPPPPPPPPEEDMPLNDADKAWIRATVAELVNNAIHGEISARIAEIASATWNLPTPGARVTEIAEASAGAVWARPLPSQTPRAAGDELAAAARGTRALVARPTLTRTVLTDAVEDANRRVFGRVLRRIGETS